ncbi:MAG: GNAT family N-acetyltransferase [Oscillospiraceae bacterium]
MELREMTREERKHWFDVELAEAFLPAEIKPLEDMERMTLQGTYLPLGLFEGDTLLGYATFWQRPDVGYVVLDYLGVTQKKRNSGLGSVILKLVAERFGDADGILVESEALLEQDDGENTLRARRIGFYERNGYQKLYLCGMCGLTFQALLCGKMPADLAPVMEAHRALYHYRSDVRVPLNPGEIPPPPPWMLEKKK